MVCLESYVISICGKQAFYYFGAFLIRSLTPDYLKFLSVAFLVGGQLKLLSSSQTFSEILCSQDFCLFCAFF